MSDRVWLAAVPDEIAPDGTCRRGTGLPSEYGRDSFGNYFSRGFSSGNTPVQFQPDAALLRALHFHLRYGIITVNEARGLILGLPGV